MQKLIHQINHSRTYLVTYLLTYYTLARYAGQWAPVDCPHFQPNTSTPYCDESWTVPAEVLAQHKWSPTLEEVHRYRALYDTYAKARLSAIR